MSSAERPQLKVLNSRKRQTLFTAGIIAALLVIVLSIYAILVTPARQPYRDALAQYKNVYDANIAVITAGAAVNAGGATDAEFEAATEQVNAALDRLDTENQALGEVSVMQEGEPHARYETFTAELNDYLAFNYDMITSMQMVRPVVFECSRVMGVVAENDSGVAAMQSCADDLAELEDIPNSAYASLAATYEGLYADFAETLAARAALGDPEGEDKAQAEALDDAQTSILADLDDASSAFSRALNEQKNEVDITQAAMTLDEYLRTKSSIFRG